MTNQQKPEELRLADALESRTTSWPEKVGAAVALRRLHAENALLRQQRDAEQEVAAMNAKSGASWAARVQELESQLEAIGAGGVEPLRSRCLHQIAEPASTAAALPAGWVPLTITHDGQHPEEVAYGPQIMMARLRKWLDRYFAMMAATDTAAAPKAEPADPLQQLTELSERAGLYDADFKKPSVAPSVTRFNPADGSPETALQIAAVIALHDADKPAGEYPPLPAPAQGEPWYGHHFKEVRRGYWQCGCGKAIAEAAPATSKDSYPPLPNRYTYDDDGAELFTAAQMRAYVDADRAMRSMAAPAAVAGPSELQAEAANLASILQSMVEGGATDGETDIYADDYEPPDGDVYVYRAAEVLAAFAAAPSTQAAPTAVAGLSDDEIASLGWGVLHKQDYTALKSLVPYGAEVRPFMLAFARALLDRLAAAPQPPVAAQEPVATITGVDEYGPLLGWYKHWANMPVGTRLYTHPAPQQAAQGDARALIRSLLTLIERNTCEHDETYRGGAIWEICSTCGKKWADDEGGKPAVFEWPAEVEAAREYLLASRAQAKEGGK